MSTKTFNFKFKTKLCLYLFFLKADFLWIECQPQSPENFHKCICLNIYGKFSMPWVKVQNFQILNFLNSNLKTCSMPTQFQI